MEDNISREVSELLNLDTFDNLSDEEVKKLIDYHQADGYTKGYADGFMSVSESDATRATQIAQQTDNAARAILQAVADSSGINLPLIEVIDNG